jgi:autotransporter-associated beta strand protein
MAGTGNLNFTGTNMTGNGQKEFTVSNYTTFSGPVTDGGSPTGPNIKDGTGTLALTAANTSTKNWTLNAGTLSLGNSNALGSGALTINGGGLDSTVANMFLTNAETWGGNFYFIGSQSLIITNNKVTMSAPTAISVSNSAGTLTVASPINLAAQLTKTGPGTLVLFGVNTNSGGVAVNAGTLKLGNAAALGTGTLTINGGTLDVTTSLTIANTNAQVWNGTFGYVGTTTLNMGNGAVTMNTDIIITNFSSSTLSTHALTVGGNITGPGHSLTKVGVGPVVLNGTNNYGNTIVSGGKLTINLATLNTNASVSISGGGSLVLNFSTINVVSALVSNGVSLVAGVYNSGNSGTILSGTGSLQVVPPPAGPTGTGYLTNSISGMSLNLSWPAGQGWRLQAQTNSLNIGISNNWVYVTDGSVNTNSVTVNPTNPAVFYRLTYP